MSSPEPRQSPPAARNGFPAWEALALAVAAALFLWLRLHPAALPGAGGPGLLTDPDGAMHLAVLREAQAIGTWRVDEFRDDNAPFGRFVEWSAANTTALRVAFAVLGAGWAPALFAPLLGLAAAFAIGALAWRGVRGLAILWAAAWAVVPGLAVMQSAGNLDHHTLQTGSLAVALAALLLGAEGPTRTRGLVAGAALGVLMWSGIVEAIPFLAMAVVLSGDRIHREGARAFWAAVWLAGAAVISVPLALGDWSLTNFDRLHPVHAFGWGVAGLAGAFVAGRPPGLRALLEGTVILLAGAVASVAIAAGIGGGLRGISVVLSPDFARHAEQVAEFQPLASSPLGFARAWLWQLGGLALLPCAAVRWCSGDQRRLALWAAAVMAMYLAGTLVGGRWLRAGSAVAAVAGCWALWRMPVPALARVATLGAALALPLAASIGLRANGSPGVRRSEQCHRVARECGVALAGERPVILTGLDVAPFLLAEKAALTIGSLYYANVGGLDAQALLFTARARGDFDPVAEERRVAAVLVLGRDDLANDIARAFVQRGRREPSVSDVEATVVWKLYSDPATPRTRLPSGAELLWLRKPRPAAP